MTAAIDLHGRRFGRLSVVGLVGRERGKRLWSCLCDCGNETRLPASALNSGNTKSCGCLHVDVARELGFASAIHSHTFVKPNGARYGTPTYTSWQAMKCRCLNRKHPNYQQYGAKGITVCESWMRFQNFLADMGERPAGTTLDRYPNGDGNYEPGNCRWATRSQQNLNRRSFKMSGRRRRAAVSGVSHA